MKDAIIWRKSVFENDYVCRCGKKLMVNGDVCKDALIYINNIICPECGYLFAKTCTEEEAIQEGAIRADS